MHDAQQTKLLELKLQQLARLFDLLDDYVPANSDLNHDYNVEGCWAHLKEQCLKLAGSFDFPEDLP